MEHVIMPEFRVEGSGLTKDVVYNIYENEGDVNVGVCLVISENNINNRNKIKLRKLIGNNELSLNKSEIYGKKPVNLTGAILFSANLSNAILRGANLTDANLTDAILPSAILFHANLTNTILRGANLTSAKLNFSKLTGADLTNADLTDAILNRIISGKIKGEPILPSRYVLINGYIIGPNVNLTGADLTNADLTDAILNRIISGKIKGEPILPSRYVLINGYIIGPNVNLTGADLTDADLTRIDLNGIISGKIKGEPILPSRYVLINGYIIGPNVNLFGDNLTYANLTGADLTNANLTSADLTGANLTSANLTGANLTGADLTGANLTGANLTGADLTGANLTGANLTGANLDNATIYSNQLSEEQRSKIIGDPNYIERKQQYFNINKELSNGNRISEHNGKKLENTNTKTQHRISFTRLFDFLLQEANQVKIAKRFRIGGEEGFDAGGITLIIFQKCYEVFMERYFNPYEAEDNSNYVVLKDLSDEQFEEFEKACEFMILLAKKIEGQSRQPFQILIPINFLLFQVLIFEENPETFFELGNKNKFFGKRENGSYSNQYKLNNPFNYIAKNRINNYQNNFSIQRMHNEKYNNNQNSSQEFIAKNRINNNENKFSIQRIYEGKYKNNNPIKLNDFSKDEQTKLMFLMLLEQNRIHRRKQYETMKKFIDEIFKPNKDSFTTHIDYSYKAFVKRLKFKLSDESRNRNLQSFESLEIASNPLIQLLLEYIQVSDDYRMVMTAYVCGSYCYTGDIKILIFTNPSKFPFQSRTCSKALWVYITPKKQNAFNWVLKQNTTNKNNIFSPIQKLYNVFLDRTTQIV